MRKTPAPAVHDAKKDDTLCLMKAHEDEIAEVDPMGQLYDQVFRELLAFMAEGRKTIRALPASSRGPTIRSAPPRKLAGSTAFWERTGR
jgi:hypothetical protein